jgi:hypothetical protein
MSFFDNLTVPSALLTGFARVRMHPAAVCPITAFFGTILVPPASTGVKWISEWPEPMEAAMTEPKTSFRDFEHQGWSDQEVAANYHDFFSPLTTQAIGALLDATAVRPGMWAADVATGAGYLGDGTDTPAPVELLLRHARGADQDQWRSKEKADQQAVHGTVSL